MSTGHVFSTRRRVAFAGALWLAAAAMIAPGYAQEREGDAPPGDAESRTALIARAQAEKATSLHPPVQSRAERIFRRVTGGLFQARNGFYPTAGSIYGGGGFTLGAGYMRTFGDNNIWNVRGLYSIRNYKLLEFTTLARDLARGNLDVFTTAGWRDATQVAFYGTGIDSRVEDLTHFRFKEAFAGASLRAEPVHLLFVTAGATYEDYRLERGQGNTPSIEERFTAAQAPGLGDSPGFLHSVVSTGVDSRTSEQYTRRGSLVSLAYHNYLDTGDTYSFDRLDGEAIQHVPLLRENWVVTLRGRLQTTLGDDDVVPFFLLPALGSSHTLRGYHSWRFRDRHSLLLQGEWRWIPNAQGLDMALFVDAGKVASRRADLDLRDMKTDVGIGVRFHGPTITPIRVEVARGSDGWKVVFAGNAAF